MDEKIIEVLNLANESLKLVSKPVDQVGKLNKHLVTCVTIILCVGFMVFGVCNMYQTYKQYDYELVNVNENRNENLNESGVNE